MTPLTVFVRTLMKTSAIFIGATAVILHPSLDWSAGRSPRERARRNRSRSPRSRAPRKRPSTASSARSKTATPASGARPRRRSASWATRARCPGSSRRSRTPDRGRPASARSRRSARSATRVRPRRSPARSRTPSPRHPRARRDGARRAGRPRRGRSAHRRRFATRTSTSASASSWRSARSPTSARFRRSPPRSRTRTRACGARAVQAIAETERRRRRSSRRGSAADVASDADAEPQSESESEPESAIPTRGRAAALRWGTDMTRTVGICCVTLFDARAGRPAASAPRPCRDARCRRSSRSSRPAIPWRGRAPRASSARLGDGAVPTRCSRSSASSAMRRRSSRRSAAGAGGAARRTTSRAPGNRPRRRSSRSAPGPFSRCSARCAAPTWAARRNAAWALGALDDQRAVDGARRGAQGSRARRARAGRVGARRPRRLGRSACAQRRPSRIQTRAFAARPRGPSAPSTTAGPSPRSSSALTDEDDRTRAQAAWALGAIDDSSAVPALIKALGDSAAPVRQQAAWALGAIDDRRAVDGLVRALTDQSGGVQAAGRVGARRHRRFARAAGTSAVAEGSGSRACASRPRGRSAPSASDLETRSRVVAQPFRRTAQRPSAWSGAKALRLLISRSTLSEAPIMLSGSPLRGPLVPENARAHGGHPADAGARHRRQHRDLQRHRRRAAAPVAARGHRSARDGVGDGSQHRHDARAGVLSRLPRLQGPQPHLRGGRPR